MNGSVADAGLPVVAVEPKSIESERLPGWFILAVVIACLAPSVLNLLGFDFSSNTTEAHFVLESDETTLVDNALVYLSGNITHTLLEWTAFCAAFFTVILAFSHYATTRDVVTPVIAVALFCAGIMDAFHTLAADRLIEAVADNRDLIPFTWALCRMFNALIMVVGISILLLVKKQHETSALFIASVSLVFGMLAFWSVTWAATSEDLPQTILPGAVISRPFDVAPLVIFLLAGLFLYPKMYRSRRTLFTHALIISAIPEVVVQMHMAFGSTALFDNHFNIAHFLKIVAYLVPFFGLCLENVRIHIKEAESKSRILRFQQEATEKGHVLERIVADLYREGAARQQLTDELRENRDKLEEVVDKRTEKLRLTVCELRQETQSRRNVEKELRANQSMLIHSEKMASIGQLAAGVAHEINNPTGYIISNLSSLGDYAIAIEKFLTEFQKVIAEENATGPLAQCKDTEHYRRLAEIWAHQHMGFIVDDICDLVEQTQEGATRIVKIVSSLNSFARIDDDEATAADINDCLDQTLNVAKNELKYKCEVVKDYSVLPELMCNPGQLSQVFMNILVNAAQSIADKGTIVVTTECDGAEIRVKIADDGAGMHPQILTKIFDPFFTTKKVGAGTGLGLSVSHGIVEKHGGHIQVESEIDQGSCFTVHLPINGLKDSASDHEHKPV